MYKRQIHISATFDPLPDLFAWLERIALGANEAIWVCDEEGSTATLAYSRESQVLLHCCSDYRVHASHACVVEPYRLVEGILLAFRAMVRHTDYTLREWEMPEYEPAIDNPDDTRWNSEFEARWRAREEANPYDGSILRFIESPVVEQFLEKGPQRTRRPN